MRKSNIWSLALATFAVSGAVAASALAPAITRAEEGDVSEVVYILDPESGALVNDLQNVSISFPDIKGVQVKDEIADAIVLTNKETGEKYICEYPVRADRAPEGTAFTLTFISSETAEGEEITVMPITTPGTYELSIKEGTFFYGDEHDTGESLTLTNLTEVEAINATYTVVEAAPAVAYTLDPEDGAIVNDLQTITISFEDRNVQVNDKLGTNAVVLTAENGEEYYCEAPVRDTRVAEGVAYTLNFLTLVDTDNGIEGELKPITEPGAYTLSILKGTFIRADEVEGEEGMTLENVVPVEAINATYTVAEAPTKIAYVLDPEDAAIVNDLQTITISFPDNRNIQFNERNNQTSIVLKNIETGDEYYCEAPDRESRAAEGTVFTLHFLTPSAADGEEGEVLPITKPGEYRLGIIKGAFFAADEVEAPDNTVTFENIVPVEAIYAAYTVVEPVAAVSYVLDPADESIVNDLQTISISFDDKNVQPNERMEFNAIVLTAEDGEEYYCSAPLRDTRVAQGVAYTLNFLTSVETEDGVEEVLNPITKPGAYKLSILKGTFVCGEEVMAPDSTVNIENIVPVEAINATYTVVEPVAAVSYVLDPADEAIVNDLQTISISFEDKNVQPNERMEFNAIVLTAEDGEEYYCAAPLRDTRVAQGVAYKLNFLTSVETEDGVEEVLNPITKPGAYKLSILKGTFVCGEEVMAPDSTVNIENILPVEAIYATYTVVVPDPEFSYILDPADEAVVNDLQTISLIFPDNRNIQYDYNAFNAIILTNTETGAEYYCDAPDMNSREQGMAFSLNFLTAIETADGVEYVLNPITEPGTYRLSIRKGAFLAGEEVEDAEGNITVENIVPVQAINATYTVVAPDAEFAYVLDPEDGAIVEDLQTVMINFTETTNIQYNFMEFDAIMLTNTETGKVYYCDGPDRVSRVQSGIAFSLNFLTAVESAYGVDYVLDPITEPGTYRLSIRKGAFLAADEVEDEEGNITSENIVPVQEIIATYTISNTTGVNGIFGADATEFNVYGVNGVQILKSADRNAVNALPAGLYIINGKKVIKK